MNAVEIKIHTLNDVPLLWYILAPILLPATFYLKYVIRRGLGAQVRTIESAK